jgi:Tfp pilus assembly protein PilZ
MSPDGTESSENGGGSERRRESRIAAQLEIRFGGPHEAARAFRAYSLNFSVGGLCVKTSRSYEIGEALRIRMSVQGETWDLASVVAWVHKGAIGLRFDGLSEEEQARLQALKETLEQKA